MSSPDMLPEHRLRRKLLLGHLAYAGVVSVFTLGLAYVLVRLHHEDFFEHPLESVLICVFGCVLLLLQGLGIGWCMRIGAQYANALHELRQLTDDIAHDLRTPLTRLSAAAELAAMEGMPAEELAATVGTESQNLLHLINTMLDISKTGQGLDRSPRTPVDLRQVVLSVLDLYQPLAEARGQRIAATVEAVPSIRGQEARLRQLVQNLVDNAIKFTEERGGDIEVRLRPAEKGRSVVLEVLDQGPGIRPRDIPHLFDRFYRADSARSKPGNGLGLALVKAIATSYGGHVACTQRFHDRGAVFTVSLPA